MPGSECMYGVIYYIQNVLSFQANLASVTTEKMQKHIFTMAMNATPSVNTGDGTYPGYYQGQLTIGARQGAAFVEVFCANSSNFQMPVLSDYFILYLNLT